MRWLQNRALMAVFSLGLAVLMAQVTSAQPERRGGRGGIGPGRGVGGGFSGVSRIQLALLDPVQAELKLSEKQKEALASLREEMSESRRSVFQRAREAAGEGGRPAREGDEDGAPRARRGQFGGGRDFSAFREAMENLNKEMTAKLHEHLDESQQARLTGIFAQVAGLSALADPVISEQLKITKEQNEELAEIREENQEIMRDSSRTFRELSPEERTVAFEKLRQEGEAELLAVLSDEQKAAFEEMKGEDFELDLRQLRPGGDRGFRRGGDREGRRRPGGEGARRPERDAE